MLGVKALQSLAEPLKSVQLSLEYDLVFLIFDEQEDILMGVSTVAAEILL